VLLTQSESKIKSAVGTKTIRVAYFLRLGPIFGFFGYRREKHDELVHPKRVGVSHKPAERNRFAILQWKPRCLGNFAFVHVCMPMCVCVSLLHRRSMQSEREKKKTKVIQSDDQDVRSFSDASSQPTSIIPLSTASLAAPQIGEKGSVSDVESKELVRLECKYESQDEIKKFDSLAQEGPSSSEGEWTAVNNKRGNHREKLSSYKPKPTSRVAAATTPSPPPPPPSSKHSPLKKQPLNQKLSLHGDVQSVPRTQSELAPYLFTVSHHTFLLVSIAIDVCFWFVTHSKANRI
jgi:hypothetical protein